MLTRRLMLTAAAALVASAAQGASPGPAGAVLDVYKSPLCGCCGGWVQHMRAVGFQVRVHDVEDVTSYRRGLSLPDRYASCHTGVIQGYVVEGHVPAADVQRLLRERPMAIGLAVPGMPPGSPGMEAPGTRGQAYATLLVSRSGSASMWQRHG